MEFILRTITRARNKVLSILLDHTDNDCLISAHGPRLANLVNHMATTGRGTDECMEEGCLPVPTHFYSAIPDLKDLKERNIWSKRSTLAGITCDFDRQMDLLKDLGGRFGSECIWPTEPTANPYDFFVNNSSFSYGCAASLHSIIRRYNPSRIIEIGSGNSSLVISRALSVNQLKMSQSSACQYTIIDPYPRDIIQALPGLTNLIKQRVELCESSFFNCLGENDILFIDSSHSVKIGSDVNFLILEVLPRLAPGVIIHFHDIPMPFEYPMGYAINPSFRMFWTESYLLQAFLSHNENYEILLVMCYLMSERKEEFKEAFSQYNPDEHKAISGSFWIRRK